MGRRSAVATAAPLGLVGNVLEMIENPQTDGLAGLARQFQERGLGNLMSGWIGTGPNPPISPAQVQTALGSRQLGLLAGKTGLSLPALMAQLSTILPMIVDDLTPDGQVPGVGTLFSPA